ncbi:MAG: alpha/beta fold hydrolase [Pseudomonadota bacterium]
MDSVRTKPRRAYVDGACGQLHYRFCAAKSVRARPLYALHQSPKSSLSFEAFMAAACGDRDVVAPDYPGYGMSDPPPSEDEASVELYAAECWRVADAHGHSGPIDLLGHHTGGKVALEMAHQRPDHVGGVVIVSAAVLTDAEREQFRDYFTPIPLDEAGTRFTTMWARIHKHAGPGMTLAMKATALFDNLMGGEAYEWGHKAAFDNGPKFERLLGALPHRITVVNVADELQEATRRAAPLLNNGALIERPDWGHGLFDTFTDDVVATVKQALDV